MIDRSGTRCLTAGQDRTARLWSLPAAAPGMSNASAAAGISPAFMAGHPGGGPDAGGQNIIGTVALEMELSGRALSNPATGVCIVYGLGFELGCASTVTLLTAAASTANCHSPQLRGWSDWPAWYSEAS